MDGQTFRQERIDLGEHTSVIFTSRNAVDHYFRMAEELRLDVLDSMKYFCISESRRITTKYIVYRKRKIFHGQLRFTELSLIKKHKKEKFLLPCADILKPSIPALLEENNIDFTKAVMYKTVCSDLSDLSDVKYDMLVFSPSGIESLFKTSRTSCRRDPHRGLRPHHPQSG